jgi:RNA polymerase sigma factor (sigma-70 family)
VTNDEIIKMCRSLARKYNDPQEYDDLVSEGVIACMEMVNQGKTDKNLLYSHAKREMHDYYNLKRTPVYVPSSSKVHSMGRETSVDGWTETAMQNALYGEAVEIEEHTLQVPSTEELYERKEWLARIQTIAITCLTQEEWAIVKMRYWEDMTQDDVAKVMCRNQKWVSRKEKSALDKICNNL